MGKISATELIFAYPGKSFMSVLKLSFTSCKANVGMFFYNTETVVSVDDNATPYNNGADDNSVSEDIFFKLFELIIGKWWNPAFKFRVYS